MKSLTDIKQEGRVMRKIIDDLKGKIKQIQAENIKIEEELVEEADKEYETEEKESLQLAPWS